MEQSGGSATLEGLWQAAGFAPNRAQERAIRHTKGPLFITAGPGSGKTRVLLWRTVNLIVFHDLHPEEIYLSTFTEKAATQLKEGLRSYLGQVSNITGQQYDISRMYIGTVHSSCRSILSDRRFSRFRQRPEAPVLMDALQQYLFIYDKRRWDVLTRAGGWDSGANQAVNSIFHEGSSSMSRHAAVTECIALFNRLSEELIEPEKVLPRLSRNRIRPLVKMYARYRELLAEENRCDLSLVQKAALDVLKGNKGTENVFKHVIVDEYQDTNTVQERLFFTLARGWKNICVVGDDDQALYRFRGATVENFVQFAQRSEKYLGTRPRIISLVTNYRSQDDIVRFYGKFIDHDTCDWRVSPQKPALFRVPKKLDAHRQTRNCAVIATEPTDPASASDEIAGLVERIIHEKKVEDASQIAFLYPSLGGAAVQPMIDALEKRGLKTYAPRAEHFLEVPESQAVFGSFFHVFDKPEPSEGFGGRDYSEFFDWVERSHRRAGEIIAKDRSLAEYVADCREQVSVAALDSQILTAAAERADWDLEGPLDAGVMLDVLGGVDGLSSKAKRGLTSRYFKKYAARRQESSSRPLTLRYVISRFSSLDWNVLDLFYRFSGFKFFKRMYDAATGGDEGPICNLSLVSRYLGYFLDLRGPIITGQSLANQGFQRHFFQSYLFALYRRGESAYENPDDPFPRGRIPFLTIHQAKGLEFPVVVLGSARKDNRGPQKVETMIEPFLTGNREPLERIADFDKMRMFYVALSRPMNLLVIAHLCSRGNHVSEPFNSLLQEDGFPRIKDFDVSSLPEARIKESELPKTYSYTGDYLFYKRCARSYMVFGRYDFAPARTQTMFFGSLVHQTIEDLHQYLISARTSR